MQDRHKKTVEGVTPFGDKRTYTFNLMDADTGLEVFHETVSLLMVSMRDILPAAMPLVEQLKEKEGKEEDKEEEGFDIAKYIGIAEVLPSILKFKQVKGLAKDMLSGMTVVIDGKSTTAADNGLGEYALGDPMEVYFALFYAICANFPKYLNMFTEDDSEKKKDTTPAS